MRIGSRIGMLAGILLLVAVGALFGQTGDTQTPQTQSSMKHDEQSVRVFDVPASLIQSISQILGSPFNTFRLSENTLAVRGKPHELDEAAKMVQTLLAAAGTQNLPTQATLFVSVVGANHQGQSGALPEWLQPTVAELRRLFPYQSYRVLDTMPIQASRTSNQPTYGTSSILPDCSAVEGARCNQSVNWVMDRFDADGVLNLKFFEYRLNIPVRTKTSLDKETGESRTEPVFERVGLQTSLTIARGQTVVVGKVNPGGNQDAIFVVVSRLKE